MSRGTKFITERNPHVSVWIPVLSHLKSGPNAQGVIHEVVSLNCCHFSELTAVTEQRYFLLPDATALVGDQDDFN